VCGGLRLSVLRSLYARYRNADGIGVHERNLAWLAIAWMRQKRYRVLTSAKVIGLVRPFLCAVERVKKAARRVIDARAGAFWVRFAQLSDEARRQVKQHRSIRVYGMPVWDARSFKVLASLKLRRRLVRDCWAYASELDRFRALYRRLVNADLDSSIMISAYFN